MMFANLRLVELNDERLVVVQTITGVVAAVAAATAATASVVGTGRRAVGTSSAAVERRCAGADETGRRRRLLSGCNRASDRIGATTTERTNGQLCQEWRQL